MEGMSMSTERKELNSNFYANYLNVDYLSERDKYLFKKASSTLR